MLSPYQIKRKSLCNDTPKKVRWVGDGTHRPKRFFVSALQLMPIAGQAPRKIFRLRELKETPLKYFFDLGKNPQAAALFCVFKVHRLKGGLCKEARIQCSF